MSSGNVSGAFSICRIEYQEDGDGLNYFTVQWGFDTAEKALAGLQSMAKAEGISPDEWVVVETIFPQNVARSGWSEFHLRDQDRYNKMTASVIVWDIETVPDLRGYAAAKGLIGKPDDEVRAEMGDKFPKLIESTKQTTSARHAQNCPSSAILWLQQWLLRSACALTTMRTSCFWR
jgi:hypothetical protein